MILVFFRGLGEWFVPQENGSIRLAITRTTKTPYKPCEAYDVSLGKGLDYDDWLASMNENDTNKNFSEWVRLNEANNIHTPEDYEYNKDLGGIFVREPELEGDIYNTDGLRSFGANTVKCFYMQGVFKLTDEDEKACNLSSFDAIKSTIKRVLPCQHESSGFLKSVTERGLSKEGEDKYFFEIQNNEHLGWYGTSKPIKREYILEPLNIKELSPDSVHCEVKGNENLDPAKKLQHKQKKASLEAFISWLEHQVNMYKIDSFSVYELDCTKAQLLQALKLWEAGQSH